MRIAMSAIAATGSSSSYSAVAQLLANSLSSATPGISQTGQSTTSGSGTPTSGSSDSLDLSDHAKAILARAKTDQVAADELQTFLQAARNPNGTGGTSASSQASGDNGTQIFDQLTGQTQSQSANTTFITLNDFLNADVHSLIDANTGPDGTVGSYSQTLQDVTVTAPSNPQQVAAWYQTTDAQALAGAAQYWPNNDPGLAEALASHAVTFLNGSDIPNLNFHNTISIQGGEGGASVGDTYTYNHDAAIFSDPTTSYKVLYDGTVISWKTPPSTGTAASN
jgi:hypothetical protein